MPTETGQGIEFFGGEFSVPALGIARSPWGVGGRPHPDQVVHLRLLLRPRPRSDHALKSGDHPSCRQTRHRGVTYETMRGTNREIDVWLAVSFDTGSGLVIYLRVLSHRATRSWSLAVVCAVSGVRRWQKGNPGAASITVQASRPRYPRLAGHDPVRGRGSGRSAPAGSPGRHDRTTAAASGFREPASCRPR